MLYVLRFQGYSINYCRKSKKYLLKN
jgi:hypothetical protein